MRYIPRGVCSRAIDIEVKDGIIESVKFTGGCNGNTQGVAALVAGGRCYLPSQGNQLQRKRNLLSGSACPRFRVHERKLKTERHGYLNWEKKLF